MILEVEKKPKVALCRKCYGTGRLHLTSSLFQNMFVSA